MSVLLLTLCITIATNLTNVLLINYTFRKYVHLYFNSYDYGCGVRSLTGHSRILIPDKEWDLLGAHFDSEKESLKGLTLRRKEYREAQDQRKRRMYT